MSFPTQPVHPFGRQQRGATLVVAMVMLLILTLLGLQGLNNVTLQERMAGSTQDALRAFSAAESGLAAAVRDASRTPGTTVANQSPTFAIAPPPAEDNAVQRVTGANYLLVPRGETAVPPRGSKFDARSGASTTFFFELIATGFGEATAAEADPDADFTGIPESAVVRLHGGLYQIGALGSASSGSYTESSPGFVDDGT